MAVRNCFLVGAAAATLAACTTATNTSPTPPPGLSVAPKAQIVFALDRAARARWKEIAPGVKSLVFASTAVSLVDLVEYASSNAVIDPYKDNFRYVLDGRGLCKVEDTQIPVGVGDLVVTPMGMSRSCRTRSGTLTFLAVSLSRGQSRAGVYLRPPPAGRIRAGVFIHSLPVASSALVTRELYGGFYGEILAAKIGVLDFPSPDADEFVYVQGGEGTLLLAGRRSVLRPGTIFVAPAGARFSMRASGKPLEALVVRSYREVSSI